MPGLLTRQIEIGGRVGWNSAGTAEPRKKAPYATEPSELGVDHQGLIAAWTTVAMEE